MELGGWQIISSERRSIGGAQFVHYIFCCSACGNRSSALIPVRFDSEEPIIEPCSCIQIRAQEDR